MAAGKRIRFFRNLRGLKQKELGTAVGFSSTTAEARIAQYETELRLPRKDLLTKIASWLTPAGNYYSFAGDYSGETTLVILRYIVKKALPGDIRNLALFLVFTLIAAFLFKKRKNEMAGVSLAFPAVVPLVMILLLVPGMLMTGLVVGTILPGFTAERFIIWSILMVLIGMAANCLIEAYIEGDIRFAFRRFWAFLLASEPSSLTFSAMTAMSLPQIL